MKQLRRREVFLGKNGKGYLKIGAQLVPNKVAWGMTKTRRRHKFPNGVQEPLNGDAVNLRMHGTLDELVVKRWLEKEIEAHTVTTYGLSDTGKQKLKELRIRQLRVKHNEEIQNASR